MFYVLENSKFGDFLVAKRLMVIKTRSNYELERSSFLLGMIAKNTHRLLYLGHCASFASCVSYAAPHAVEQLLEKVGHLMSRTRLHSYVVIRIYCYVTSHSSS